MLSYIFIRITTVLLFVFTGFFVSGISIINKSNLYKYDNCLILTNISDPNIRVYSPRNNEYYDIERSQINSTNINNTIPCWIYDPDIFFSYTKINDIKYTGQMLLVISFVILGLIIVCVMAHFMVGMNMKIHASNRINQRTITIIIHDDQQTSQISTSMDTIIPVAYPVPNQNENCPIVYPITQSRDSHTP